MDSMNGSKPIVLTPQGISQTEIERLKSYILLHEYSLISVPDQSGHPAMQVLIEAWNALPKFIAFVEAYDWWLKLYTEDCREDLEDDGSLELAVLNLDSAREALNSKEG